MVLWVGRVNKDIVKENQDEFIQVLTKKIVYHVHKLGGGVGDTKRHDQELIEPLTHAVWSPLAPQKQAQAQRAEFPNVRNITGYNHIIICT